MDTFEKDWADYLQLQQEAPELFAQNALLPIIFSEEKAREYAKRTGERVGVTSKTDFHYLVADLVQDGEGNTFPYERVIPRPYKGGVAMLTEKDGKFLLLKQYRHAIRDYEYSIPRGRGEYDIASPDNAKKELREELGVKEVELIRLGSLTPDTGLTATQMEVYYCKIHNYQKKRGYEGIDDVLELTELEMQEFIAEGKTRDSFTLSAWALYQAQRGRIKELEKK